MNFTSVTLCGANVELEPFRPEHFDEVCAAALSAPDVFRFMPTRVANRDDMRARVDATLAVLSRDGGEMFVTRDRETKKVVGSTTCYVTDRQHRRIEIGSTWLVPSAQRTHVNTEAKYLQLRHCFEVVGAIRVEFKTDARNARSRAAIARIGGVEEGVLRSHMICWDGHRRDSVYFSIIEPEWPNVCARLEARLNEPRSR